MAKKSFEERYKDEALTNNADIPKYEQCKDCMFRKFEIDGTLIDDYRRTCCSIYAYPDMKPLAFCDGSASCELYEKE